ncbi:MAG TPA: hypothetical protein VGR43_10020 [Dehalococcoidia bacterium]|jgi:hypothetical protein|nr:hypothetical protein [Dehalococcoidia bacterium]
MNELFLVTGALAAFGGLGHGYLGERLILIPLTQRAELPSTRFGGARQTAMMLRFTWHFFTVVMLSLAVVFFALGSGIIGGGDWTAVRVLAGYFAVFGVLVLALSRGRHFAWLIGLGAASTAWLGTL